MAQERVLRGDTGRSGLAISRMMAAVMTDHFDRPLYASATALDTELEGIQHVIERHATPFPIRRPGYPLTPFGFGP